MSSCWRKLRAGGGGSASAVREIVARSRPRAVPTPSAHERARDPARRASGRRARYSAHQLGQGLPPARRAHADHPLRLGPAEVEMEVQRRGLERRGSRRGRARGRRAGARRAPRSRTIWSAMPPGTAGDPAGDQSRRAAAGGQRRRRSAGRSMTRPRPAPTGRGSTVAGLEVHQQPALARDARARAPRASSPQRLGLTYSSAPAYQTRGATSCCTW